MLFIISFNNLIFLILIYFYLISIDIDMLELGWMVMKKLYELIYEELMNGVCFVIFYKLIKCEIVIFIY